MRFDERIRWKDKTYLSFCGQPYDLLTACVLFLQQGPFEHKVGFDVNIHLILELVPLRALLE